MTRSTLMSCVIRRDYAPIGVLMAHAEAPGELALLGMFTLKHFMMARGRLFDDDDVEQIRTAALTDLRSVLAARLNDLRELDRL